MREIAKHTGISVKRLMSSELERDHTGVYLNSGTLGTCDWPYKRVLLPKLLVSPFNNP